MTHDYLPQIGATTTGALSLTAWLADIEIYLRLGVAAVGIAVGILTGLYYYEAWMEKRRNRKA
jgi:hypothetical protein